MELGEFGIRVNAILSYSGSSRAAAFRRLFEARAEEERGVAPEEQLKLAMTQSSKLVQPQQLANMIVFQAG